MARFTIYSPTGTALYTGTPSFTGQYMKPGLLEFREVSVPTLLALEPGCYVNYDRTGYRYRIYTVPQIKKQARRATYGGAFVFQGVQLYDASKQLEYCPFRDLVKGDNRIHFSTQPSISTFEGVDGLARRFEACLRDQYDVEGVQSWAVRIATPERDGVDSALYEMMLEPREFTVSGMNILECLDKVYEIWPDVGWVYKVENGIDTIVIGGGGINANSGTYAYGKGRGLTSLTRVAANAEEIANRIFAYGSNQNMLPRWYNSQQIKDAESVDIQNLMLPIGQVGTYPGWGLTDDLPDAAKAFVENAASIAKNGLRPATVYFDGSGEYPAIYPSIRETTIGMVRTAIGDPTAKYYPSTAIYDDADARIDQVLTAPAVFDSGKAGEDGKAAVKTDSESVSDTASGSVPEAAPPFQKLYFNPFYSKTVEIDGAGDYTLKLNVPATGTATLTGALGYLGICIRAYRINGDSTETLVGERETKMEQSSTDATAWAFKTAGLTVSREAVSTGQSVRFEARVVIAKTSQGAGAYTIALTGNASYSVAFFRAKTFTISIRQVGFDINEQAALGDGKTIAMRSGKCAGRSFAINDVQYDSATDSWMLECWRSEDESLSQWFPNTDYPVEADDEFVLLDIAMPETYIGMAEVKLLRAAEELLADTAVERWQYTPEIDAKYMIENNRVIRAGDFMVLIDNDLIDGSGGGGEPGELVYFQHSGGGYFLTKNGEKIAFVDDAGAVRIIVDTIVINEGEAAIPTYKVTLRDRKKKTWTTSESAPTSSSKSVGNTREAEAAQYIDLSNYVTTEMFESLSSRVATLEAESFFMLDTDGNVTLKAAYQNLWVPGWLAAGGVGSGGGGGGGGSSTLAELLDVSLSGLANGDVLTFNSSTNHWQNTPKATFLSGYATQSWVQQQGYALSSAIPTESTVAGWGFTKNAGTVTSVKLLQGTGISVTDSGTAITTSGERTISITQTYQNKINNGDTAYSWGNHANQGYLKASDITPLSDRISAVEGWFSVVQVNGVDTLKLNPAYAGLWAEGWLGAGGIGNGSSGGGLDVPRMWQSLTNSPADAGYENTKIALAHIPDITTAKITNLESWIAGKGYITGHQTIYALKLQAGSFSAVTYTPNSAAKTVKIPTTLDHIADGSSRKLSDYARASDLTSLSSRITSVEGWFEVVTVDGVQALHAKGGRAIYSDSWVAAGGVGSGSSGGGLDVPRMWQSLTNNPADAGYENTKIALAHIPDITTAKISNLESWINSKGFIASETDPTVPAWAKSATKPSYAFSELTSHPTTLSGYGITDAKFGTPGTDNVPITLGSTTKSVLTDHQDLTPLTNRLSAIEDWFEIVNVGTAASPNYALHAKQGRAIYSDSWIAAGGVGSGSSSSGGLITRVRSITDLGTAIATESLTETFSAKAIEGIYEAVRNLAGSGLATQTWVQNQNYLQKSGGTITGDVTFNGGLYGPISGTERNWGIDNDGTATFNSLVVGGSFFDPSQYVKLNGAQSISGVKTFSGGITMDTASILTASDSTNSIGASGTRFLSGHIRNIYTTYFAFMSDDGQTQRGTIGMGSGYASINLFGTPNVSYSFFGDAGFFHSGDGAAPCGRSDHRWEKVWSVDADLSGGLVIGGDIVPSADLGSQLGYSNRRFSNLNVRTLGSVKEINFKDSNNSATTGYLSFANGWMILRAGANIESSYKQINLHGTYGLYPENGSSINLGYYNSTDNRYRWANIYGVNADLTGDLALAQTSHIDIGPLRIEYDSATKALHITKKSNSDTNNYGIYADGFVAAGGVGQTS